MGNAKDIPKISRPSKLLNIPAYLAVIGLFLFVGTLIYVGVRDKKREQQRKDWLNHAFETADTTKIKLRDERMEKLLKGEITIEDLLDGGVRPEHTVESIEKKLLEMQKIKEGVDTPKE